MFQVEVDGKRPQSHQEPSGPSWLQEGSPLLLSCQGQSKRLMMSTVLMAALWGGRLLSEDQSQHGPEPGLSPLWLPSLSS